MKGSPKEIGSILFFTNILILIKKRDKNLNQLPAVFSKKFVLESAQKKTCISIGVSS